MQMQGNGVENTGRENKYLFNGNELQSDFGLNTYDFINRNYDPAIGRFWQIDPLADHPNQLDKSPFAFSWNNPVLLNDPDGNCPNCEEGESDFTDQDQINQIHADAVVALGTLIDNFFGKVKVSAEIAPNIQSNTSIEVSTNLQGAKNFEVDENNLVNFKEPLLNVKVTNNKLEVRAPLKTSLEKGIASIKGEVRGQVKTNAEGESKASFFAQVSVGVSRKVKNNLFNASIGASGFINETISTNKTIHKAGVQLEGKIGRSSGVLQLGVRRQVKN